MAESIEAAGCMLYHCAIVACYTWPNWEMCLLLFNMGHMIYVLDQFFDVNSMVVSVVIRLTIFGNFSKCAIYIPPRPVFQCEFKCDVHFVIRVTIYGNSGKHISVIYVLEQIFDVNLMVMSVCDQSDCIWQ